MDQPTLLPPEPRQPEESECCGQGCRSCVHDIYKQELLIWQKKCMEVKACSVEPETQMCEETYMNCIIESVEQLCPSVLLFQFKLPDNNYMKFTAGQHVIARETTSHGTISRPYTIITSPGLVEMFSVLIRLYNDGKMSNIIRNKWQRGYSVAWRGPIGDCDYKPNKYKNVLMIAAGTGITPMYQLAKLIVDNPDDETRVTLLYGCKNYQEILLRPQLHQMQDYWNFKVCYFLSDDIQQSANLVRKHNEDISYHRIDDEVVERMIKDMNGSLRVYLCGPKAFEKDVLMNLTVKLTEKNSIVTF